MRNTPTNAIRGITPLVVLLLCGGSFMLPASVSPGRTSASIVLSTPSAIRVTVGEGDDFATSVLHDPWDMDRPRDLQYEMGFSSNQTVGGVWQGVTHATDDQSGQPTGAYIVPLFHGFQGELLWHKWGALDQYAINPAKYRLLAYRVAVDAPDAISNVYWNDQASWPTGNHTRPNYDTCVDAATNWNIRSTDLGQAADWSSLSSVRSLRIDPYLTSPKSGTLIKLDWIRLVDPASSPQVPVAWNASGAPGGSVVDIYVSKNSNGSEATRLVSGLSPASGSYTLKTAVLPPGDWYVQVKLVNPGTGCGSVLASSSWAGPINIIARPSANLTRPGFESGEDYAARVVHNPWDMDGAGDLVPVDVPGGPPRTIGSDGFASGLYSGRAIINPAINVHESDAQVWLKLDGANGIDTHRYRYLSVRIKLGEPSPYKDINWRIANGWGGRVTWWRDGVLENASQTKFGSYYEGWNTYAIDLGKAVHSVSPGPENPLYYPAGVLPQAGWNSIGRANVLRYDLLETTTDAINTHAAAFELDYVKLTAMDEVRSGQPFALAFTSSLPLTQTRIYYTTDPRNAPTQNLGRLLPAPSRGTGLTRRAFMPAVQSSDGGGIPGNPATRWDTTGVATGEYFVCLRLDDALNLPMIVCSDTPVRVLPA